MSMSASKTIIALSDSRWWWVLWMGFSSGFPLALTGSTLQAWFAMSDVSIVTIGALTLIGQPYLYKFMWAPAVDRIQIPWLGRRRGWLLCLQVALAVALVFMSFQDPTHTPWALGFFALAVAFLSATQDTVIDAYRTEILSAKEWGFGGALNTVGYRIALLISGAFALVLAAHIGWHFTYLIMAAFMLGNALITLFVPRLPDKKNEALGVWQSVVTPLRDMLTRPVGWATLVFIVLYKIGDAYGLSLTTAFLLRGVGFSLVDVAAIYKIVGAGAIILGSIVGGVWLMRLSLYRGLMLFGLLQAFATLSFALLALVGKNYLLMVFVIFAENFTAGLASVAFIALISALCNKRFTATQFALLTALAGVGRVFVGPIAGVTVSHVGWVTFYIFAFALCFPGLFLLRWLSDKVPVLMDSSYAAQR